MKLHPPVLAALALVGLAACSDGLVIPRVPTRLVYDGTTGEVPLPNDVLFAANEAAPNLDATLNLPPAGDPAQQALVDALNSLDGWSTTAPISFHFSRGVDAATVVAGQSVRFFAAEAFADPLTGLQIGTPLSDIQAELVPGVDYVVVPAPSDPSGATWAILPLLPLAPASAYLVVVTDAVLDLDGFPVEPGSSYALAKASTNYPPDHPARDLQVLVFAMELLASIDPDVVPPIPREEVVGAFSFTTQSTTDVLAATQLVALGLEQGVLDALCAGAPGPGHAACTAMPANTVPSLAPGVAAGDTTTVGGSGAADIWTASLTLPYYLVAAPNPSMTLPVQDTGPVTGRWTARFSFLEGVVGADPMETERNATRYNPLPLETGAEIVPVLVTLPPLASQPPTGWPVVVFLHGFTSDRTALLGLADELADQGFAGIAIDMPLHGLLEAPAMPLDVIFAGFQDGGLRERTFGLDLLDPIGTADPSGANFVNLSSLQTGRDNLRQAVADHFALLAGMAANLDVDGMGLAADFDLTQVHLVGHSLGGIVGTAVAALDAAGPSPLLASATFSAPGGGIPRMLEASELLGPPLLAALASAGLDPGTPEFDSFMVAAQSVLDSGDPLNFAAGLASAGSPLLLHEVVGGGPGGGEPDQVVPNAVATAPLSGTEPLVRLLGLETVSSDVPTMMASDAAVVRFSEGTHSSLLVVDPGALSDPAEAAAAVEMQLQVTLWLASIATAATVTITDPSVVAPDPND